MLFDGIICLILHIGLLSPVRRCKNTRVMGAIKNNLNSCEESLVNGTNDREAHPKFWIAALVQMNCERKSAEKLSKLGISNYVPIQEEIHQWSDRRKKITRVVIPMVVFVRVDEIERNLVRDLSFIYKLITYPGQSQPAIIPDSQISQLQFMVDNSKDQIVFKESSLCIGDTIQVIRGPLKGLTGSVCQTEDKKLMVAVRLDFLGYACVNIPITDIEQIK